MSPNVDPGVKVQMLPPSFALYLKGALFIPVLIKPDLTPIEVYVAPVVLASNIRRIHWSLVLLSKAAEKLIEFAQEPISFTQTSGPIVPMFGFPRALSTTQIVLDIAESTEPVSLVTFQYDLFFQLRSGPTGPLGPVIQAIVADPSVAITPDPVDIPTWP